MKNVLLAVAALFAFSAAACNERKDDPRPDYEGARSKAQKSHQSLDKETVDE